MTPSLPIARAIAQALGVPLEIVFPPPPCPADAVQRGVTALADGVRRRNPGALVEVEMAP